MVLWTLPHTGTLKCKTNTLWCVITDNCTANPRSPLERIDLPLNGHPGAIQSIQCPSLRPKQIKFCFCSIWLKSNYLQFIAFLPFHHYKLLFFLREVQCGVLNTRIRAKPVDQSLSHTEAVTCFVAQSAEMDKSHPSTLTKKLLWNQLNYSHYIRFVYYDCIMKHTIPALVHWSTVLKNKAPSLSISMTDLSVCLVVGASTLVITNIATIISYIMSTVHAFTSTIFIKSFFVWSCVFCMICHPLYSTCLTNSLQTSMIRYVSAIRVFY